MANRSWPYLKAFQGDSPRTKAGGSNVPLSLLGALGLIVWVACGPTAKPFQQINLLRRQVLKTWPTVQSNEHSTLGPAGITLQTSTRQSELGVLDTTLHQGYASPFPRHDPERCQHFTFSHGRVRALKDYGVLQKTRSDFVAIQKRTGLIHLICRGQWGNRIGEYVAMWPLPGDCITLCHDHVYAVSLK